MKIPVGHKVKDLEVSEPRVETLVEEARKEFLREPSRQLLDFVAATQRGVCADVGRGRRRQEPAEGETEEEL